MYYNVLYNVLYLLNQNMCIFRLKKQTLLVGRRTFITKKTLNMQALKH
jgi:hypothetical protein